MLVYRLKKYSLAVLVGKVGSKGDIHGVQFQRNK